MADDRTDLPGSGNVEPEERSEETPPPSPQATSYDTQAPPEPEATSRSWGPVCLIGGILGCGCLLIVLLAFGIIGGVGWGIFGGEGEGQSPPNAPPTPPGAEIEQPAPPPGSSLDPRMDPATDPMQEQPTADPEGDQTPGPQAAMRWANEHRPDWEATIHDSFEDWEWVYLTMGPPGSGGTTKVELRWDAGTASYRLVDEWTIVQDEPMPEDAPEIYQPGEEVAKEAALGYVEQPDWMARVDSHSDDWRRATVSVGPPASEWVYVVTLQWNDEGAYYDQVSIDDVDYPGME